MKTLTSGTCTTSNCISQCEMQEIITCSSITAPCDYLYYTPENGITNKDIFDRFLTALILSLFVCLANIGLALFGFLLFRTPGDF